jgi:hypothetical protein
MRKVCVYVISVLLADPISAANRSREQKRLEACGQVFKEILDIPDRIPKELLTGVRSPAEPAGTLRGTGALTRCSHSKVQTSVFSWAVKPRTSFSWCYGRSLSAKETVRREKVGVPGSGRELISLLDKKSPKNESDPVSLRD